MGAQRTDERPPPPPDFRRASVVQHLFDLQIEDNEKGVADLRTAVNAACRDVDWFRFSSRDQQIGMTAQQLELLAKEIEGLAALVQELVRKVRAERSAQLRGEPASQ